MNLTVYEKDLLSIGHTWFNDGGRLSILAGGETAGVESILLRSILLCFGYEYVITDEEDYECEDRDVDVDILFKTNLPYERFEEVARD